MNGAKTKIETDKTFSLIEGKFSGPEAKEVLYALIGDKIRFHNNRIHRCWECGEGDAEFSKNRIKELMELREQMDPLFETATELDLDIKISSTFEVKLEK